MYSRGLHSVSSMMTTVLRSRSQVMCSKCLRLMSDSGSSAGDGGDGGNKFGGEYQVETPQTLDLAKPLKKFRVYRDKKRSRNEINFLHESSDELGSEIVQAVKAVAAEAEDINASGSGARGDANYRKSVQSDLLNRLKEEKRETKRRQKLGDILAGMNIDKKSSTEKSVTLSDSVTSSQEMMQVQHESGKHEPLRPPTNLFGAEPLRMFKHINDPQQEPKLKPGSTGTGTALWDRLERIELDQILSQPPRNGWEEMILWTKQGKIWNFPIDNEQGMESACSESFDAHVMLDHLLDEGFPRRGPVRHFMELVVAGLIKNYHLTVQEKHDHIAWYREYFHKHQELLDSVIQDTFRGSDEDNLENTGDNNNNDDDDTGGVGDTGQHTTSPQQHHNNMR